MKLRRLQTRGFTIVELLIVIVVIGILAGLSIVAYNGIQNRAGTTLLKSDLNSAVKQLENANTVNGQYPSSATDIKKSDGTTYQYTYTSGTNSYCLTGSNRWGEYNVSNTNRTPQDGVCSGHVSQLSPPEPESMPIASGSGHSCGLTNSGTAYCWGYGASGQLGNNSTSGYYYPVAVSTSGVLSGKTLVAISAGGGHNCALDDSGSAYCWGRNDYGQLGNGSTTDSSTPVAVNNSGVLSGKVLISIVAGGLYSCAVDSSGSAYCWGYNGYGQLGNGSTTNSSVAVTVTSSGALTGKTILKIGTGNDHTCTIASDSNAYCWGRGTAGKLGNGSTTNSTTPVAVSTSGVLSGKTLVAISVADDYACTLDSSGVAYCWGYNGYGQLGNNSTTQSSVPVAVSTAGVLSGKTLTTISAGSMSAACVLDSGGLAYCWGRNNYGQLGNNSTTQSSVPVAVSTAGVLSGKTLTTISTYYYHSCAVDTSRLLYCWGYNPYGELGKGDAIDSQIPADVNTPF